MTKKELSKTVLQHLQTPKTMQQLVALTGVSKSNIYHNIKALMQNKKVIETETIGNQQCSVYVIATAERKNDLSCMTLCQAVRYVRRNIHKSCTWLDGYLKTMNKPDFAAVDKRGI